jgi:hypothetical protein
MLNSPLSSRRRRHGGDRAEVGRDARGARLDRLYAHPGAFTPATVGPSLDLVPRALGIRRSPGRRSYYWARARAWSILSHALFCLTSFSISIEEAAMSGPRPIGISRRALLKDAACGFGYLAFAGLASQAAASERNPLQARLPHFAPRAKRVIFMFMHGGPSQVDTFDYKPALLKYSGKPAPFVKPSDFDEPRKKKIPMLRETPWKFAQNGECRRWV